jgi:hypothetical protein
MQTYIFTVVVQGEDVQDAAATMQERTIEAWNSQDATDTVGVTCHVTESVRVSE